MYGLLLGPLIWQDKPLKLFEIGLGCNMGYGPGASVKLWRALFPNLNLWEADYDKACVEKFAADGMLGGAHVVTGDQASPSVLQRWIDESGGRFDVVVDDGGHSNTQIKASFDALWPHVMPGGVYFLEDLHCGRSEQYEDTSGKSIMADIIHDWTEQLLTGTLPTLSPLHVPAPLPSDVQFIVCQHEACAVGKAH